MPMKKFRYLWPIAFVILQASFISAMEEGGSEKTSSGETSEVSYAATTMQGRRSRQEDAHALVPNFHDNTSCFFAVCDAHSKGAWLSQVISQDFPRFLAEKVRASTCRTYKEIFDNAVREFDQELSKKYPGRSGGSCFIAAVIRKFELVIANTGDSRAIVSNFGKAISLSTDHKPILERARIALLGHKIDGDRVCGYNVSRALGHFDNPTLKEVLIPDPEIIEWPLQDGDEFVVVSCDGIYEAMGRQQAVDITRNALFAARQKGKTYKEASEEAACALVTAAYDQGSEDNLTAIVIVFNNQKLFERKEKIYDFNVKNYKTADEFFAAFDVLKEDTDIKTEDLLPAVVGSFLKIDNWFESLAVYLRSKEKDIKYFHDGNFLKELKNYIKDSPSHLTILCNKESEYKKNQPLFVLGEDGFPQDRFPNARITHGLLSIILGKSF
jgi:serine/threonine protein phosphatase PrpC